MLRAKAVASASQPTNVSSTAASANFLIRFEFYKKTNLRASVKTSSLGIA